MPASIVKLSTPIQHYAWGSRHAIAELQQRPAPTDEPEAELWIGDHPAAPSGVLERAGTQPIGDSRPDPAADRITPLPEWIARDPEAILGPIARRGEPQLPFLAKILAVAQPLSLQVHPGAEQAAAGFEREEAGAADAGSRSYFDPNAKREVIIALSRFEALCGLRPDVEVARLVRDSGSDSAQSLLADTIRDAPGRTGRACLAARLLQRIQDLPRASGESLVDELSVGRAVGAGLEQCDEPHWVARLCQEYPGDPLVLAPLLLNRVSLAPAEALVVQPGTLHCYLEGVGVEVMTRSNNVVRAGLTRKPVDRDEFRKIASRRAEPPRQVAPARSENGLDASYATGIEEFDVSVLETPDGRSVACRGGRVSVLLCVGGAVTVQAHGAGHSSGVRLGSGEAALIPACVEGYEVQGTAHNPKLFVVTSS